MSASGVVGGPVAVSRSAWSAWGKRLFDVTVSAALLTLLSPLFLLASMAIVVESPGSPFFTDDRVGRGGRRFRMWKLRTMVPRASRSPVGRKLLLNDPRITRMGRLLRRWSLDELPQLWNILIGDMSVVGPRPGLWEHVPQYTDRQQGRLLVRPGLTGLAQVSGRNTLLWSDRIEIDLEYIRRLSFREDLRIMAATVRTVLRGEGLYSVHQQRDGL